MSNHRPVFDQLNVVVTNMEATVAFYRLMGLEIDDTSTEWSLRHRTASQAEGGSLDFDSAEFAKTWDSGWRGGAGAVIGFRVGSRRAVDDIYQKLTEAGYRSQQSPYDAFWGARYAIVEDPDGNAVGVMSPVDPESRAAPPAPP